MSLPHSPEGYRVAIVGASSLLGKELLAVLKERRFPMSGLAELESGSGSDLELPILNLDEAAAGPSFNPEIAPGEIDLAFLAARPDPLPAFLTAGESARPIVIDLDEGFGGSEPRASRIALLERGSSALPSEPQAAIVAAAHPASIVVCLILLRLASRIEISSAVAHVFTPVSHLGPRAIEELQKQTVNLLSFQKAPRAIFGAQLAFNLLPQLAGSGSQALDALPARLGGEIGRYLEGRTPTPALRLLQAPVFYSLGVSLYVETGVAINPSRAAELLAGDGVRLRRPSDPIPSQVEVTGSDHILIHSVVSDASRPKGLWIWAVTDNLRLAALNAVEIAENLTRDLPKRSSSGNGKVVVH
jgi:aspartate-semialdehyde dehydrogenase